MINTNLLNCLRAEGLLTLDQVKQITQGSNQQSMAVISYLLKSNIFESEFLLQYCAQKFGLTIHEIDFSQAPLISELFTESFIRKHRILGLGFKDTFFRLAMSDPTDLCLIDYIAFCLENPVEIVLVDEEKLESFLSGDKNLLLCTGYDSLLRSTLEQLPVSEHEIEETNAEEPVSQFVTKLLQDAKAKNSSDIHLEPQEKDCVIRFRCDGLLNTVATIPRYLAARVMTRLKIMANLNIAERRLPQDGRIKSWIDIRINTCPTMYGEKLVLRLLDSNKSHPDLTHLGMTDEQLNLVQTFLNNPQGLIIVTGPTGSGKTVSLYSALAYLNRHEKNIVTIEDPVEISLPGINQMSVNAAIGLSFASLLHSVLRQDPDVIMVGEIRDYDTASVALSAAQTGHLVLTTLHTNNAAETRSRLQSMGVDSHLFANTNTLVIAQRLIRTLCRHCKKPDPENAGFYSAVGCGQCYQGYKGRTGIFECMHVGQYRRLWEVGMDKVKEGKTTFAELLRVVTRDK